MGDYIIEYGQNKSFAHSIKFVKGINDISLNIVNNVFYPIEYVSDLLDHMIKNINKILEHCNDDIIIETVTKKDFDSLSWWLIKNENYSVMVSYYVVSINDQDYCIESDFDNFLIKLRQTTLYKNDDIKIAIKD